MDIKEVQLIVECGKEHEELINKMGRIKYRLPMINSYVIEVPENKINNLRGLHGVISVHYNAQITAQAEAARPKRSASDAAHTTKLARYGYTGKGVSIAILDTGVAPVDDLTLPTNRITAFADFVNGEEQAYDDNGHGTHVGGAFDT